MTVRPLKLVPPLFVAVAASVLWTTMVLASAPDQMVIHVDRTTVLGVCGFPVLRHDVGDVRFQDHYDQDGNFVFENAIATNYTITYTNPENGLSLTSRRAYDERFVQFDDGSFKVVSVGLIANLIVPGVGLVADNAGNISVTFDAAGEPIDIHIAGVHDGRIPPFVCPYLQ